jgi:hypothetical protein
MSLNRKELELSNPYPFPMDEIQLRMMIGAWQVLDIEIGATRWTWQRMPPQTCNICFRVIV